VVAILPTASAIVIVVVVVVVVVAVVITAIAYYPPLRVICLIVVCMSINVSSCSLLVRLLPLPNRDESDRRSSSLLSSFISAVVLLLAPRSGRLAGWTIVLAADVGRRQHDDGSPIAVAFGGRCRRILLSSSRRPLPSAFPTPAMAPCAC